MKPIDWLLLRSSLYSDEVSTTVMNDSEPIKITEIACHCSGTTKEKIKEMVENQLTDLDDISRKTGVCSGCGSCEALVLELRAEYSRLCCCEAE